MQQRFQILHNGQEVQQSDINLLGQVGSLADDAVFAELLRLVPFTSGATKAVLPYGNLNTTLGASVVSVNAGNPASGSVLVNPFRAIVGSRAAVGAGAAANWSDIRSAVFIGGTTALSATQPLAPNASGNSRWDLVYAAVTVDGNGPSVTRYVKNPTTKVVNAQSVVNTIVTSVSIGVVTGTPAASPTYPARPADAANVYYISLAYIRVPNGFSATSVVGVNDINEVAPVVPISRTTGAATLGPANQSYGNAGTVLTAIPWSAAGGAARPAGWIPPSMVGSEGIFFKIDTITGPTHAGASDATIDNSRDWRNRFFLVFVQVGNSTFWLASDAHGGASSGGIPTGSLGTSGVTSATTLGHSFVDDLASPDAIIFQASSSNLTSLGAGSTIQLRVHSTTGRLMWRTTGTPNARIFFWLMASAQMPL